MKQELERICALNPENLGTATPQDFLFKYIDISSVEKGRIHWGQVSRYKFSEAPSRARRRVKKDDVLLCTVRPGLQAHARIPKEDGVPFVASTGFAALRPYNEEDSSFVFHQLFSKDIVAQLRSKEVGSSYPAVNESDVRQLSIFMPEPSQRKAIGKVLDTIDEAIAQTESVIAKLKQVRAGMLHDLLSYGLDEHDQLRDPIAHPEQFKDSPLGRIPINWDVGPFSEIANVNPPTPATGLSPFNFISFIPMQDVDEEGNWVYRQTRKLINCSGGYTPFTEGDVLFAKITPCMENGKGCHAIDLVNGFGMGSTEFHVLRPKSNTSARFVFHWSLTKSMRIRALAYMTGSAGQQRVEAGFFNYFLIPIPPTHEQGLIANVIDGADSKIEASRNELKKLKTLKSGLQDDLLTGRVRVPETIMEGAENA